MAASIALCPDPLIATILPASVYPLEIVQAARFPTNDNNLAKLDEQPWDDNLKAVARNPQGPSNRSDPSEPTTQKRVHKGDAFLFTDQYFKRYEPGSRVKGEADTGKDHLGFHCVKDNRRD